MIRRSVPRRGMPLGWRVGIATGVAVTLAMGGVALVQGTMTRHATNAERLQMLRLVVAPLEAELERAEGEDEAQAAVADFRRTYAERGLVAPEVELSPGYERAGSSTTSLSLPIGSADSDDERTLRVRLPAHFGEGRDTAALGGWLLHLLATLTVVVLFLLVALRRLVVRPLGRLVDTVRKMEMGYWDAVRDPGGAWEVRWLAWRFAEMGRQLDDAVKDLVHAERAATRAPLSSTEEGANAVVSEPPDEAPEESTPEPDPILEHLRELCDELARGSAAGAPDLELAKAAWTEHASEAERRGDPGLRARLEDLSLRALHPDRYAALDRRLQAGGERQREWAKRQSETLERLLREAGCPARSVEHRVKSTASVYRKMRMKGLELEQVHDLFAFRVVMPTERDCYPALGVIHREFEPLLGRFSDYIASPKPSGYKSLHTIVRSHDREGPIFEIQIRSIAMHRLSERGAAAHWRYKSHSPTRPPPVWGSELDPPPPSEGP